MADVNPIGGVARRVPLPDGTYKRPDTQPDEADVPAESDVVAKVVEPKPTKRPKTNTHVRTKNVGGDE